MRGRPRTRAVAGRTRPTPAAASGSRGGGRAARRSAEGKRAVERAGHVPRVHGELESTDQGHRAVRERHSRPGARHVLRRRVDGAGPGGEHALAAVPQVGDRAERTRVLARVLVGEAGHERVHALGEVQQERGEVPLATGRRAGEVGWPGSRSGPGAGRPLHPRAAPQPGDASRVRPSRAPQPPKSAGSSAGSPKSLKSATSKKAATCCTSGSPCGPSPRVSTWRWNGVKVPSGRRM